MRNTPITQVSSAASGDIAERPFARLLVYLHKKVITGRLGITDPMGTTSTVYLRRGRPVFVDQSNIEDRLDRVLVESGAVPRKVVEEVEVMRIATGRRLGELLEQMGLIDDGTLADTLRLQTQRKLMRLFEPVRGRFDVYLHEHAFAHGDEFGRLAIDPTRIIYPGIRASYDDERMRREMRPLEGRRMTLAPVDEAELAEMGFREGDRRTLELLGRGVHFAELDRVPGVARDVRAVILALLYTDRLQTEIVALDTGERTPEVVVFASEDLAPPDEEAAAIEDEFDEPPTWIREARREAQAEPARVPAPSPAPASAPAPASPPKRDAGTSGQRPSLGARSPARPPTHAREPVARESADGAVRVKVALPGGPVLTPAARALKQEVTEMAARADKLNHFELLGVAEDVSDAGVEAAYLAIVRRLHPDRLAAQGLADLRPTVESLLGRITAARVALADGPKRVEYKHFLKFGDADRKRGQALLEAEFAFQRGEAQLKRGDLSGAEAAFREAMDKNPAEPENHMMLVWARFLNTALPRQQTIPAALRVMREFVLERSRSARGHHQLGMVYKAMGEEEKAHKCFRTVLHLDPNHFDAQREMRLIESRKAKRAGDVGAIIDKLRKR